MAAGEGERISVQDFGLTGRTIADGLAVGRPSGLAAGNMKPLLDGIYTVKDSLLLDWMRRLKETEGIVMEPSACAAFGGLRALAGKKGSAYCREQGLPEKVPVPRISYGLREQSYAGGCTRRVSSDPFAVTGIRPFKL